MPSQFFGLNIASSGLRNANINLNTVTNNISNVNTKGYSKQKVTSQASQALRVFEKYGCAGSGVDTVDISRVRDEFYDSKYRENEIKLGESEALDYYNKMLEDYFNDDGTIGFNSIFSNLQAGIEKALSSGDTESKTLLVSDFNEMCEYFNDLYSNVQKMQSDINEEIKINVDSINSDIKKIVALNKQINQIELHGSKANELRDQRDLLVDEISKKIDVRVSEVEIKDSNNPDRKTGATRFQLILGNSICAIDGDEYKQLECVSRKEKSNESDIDGLYDITVVNKNSTTVLSESGLNYNIIGGKLQGLLEMRDGNNSDIFKGTITNSGYNTIKIALDSKEKYLYSNVPKTGKLTANGKEYTYEVKEYNNSELTLAITSGSKMPSGKVSIGRTVDYQGIPYYLNKMNTWVKKFSDNINEIARFGYDSSSNKGSNILTINGDEYDVDEINCTNIKVNKELIENPDRFPGKGDLTEGESELRNLSKMNDFIQNSKIFDNSGAKDFLTKILSSVVLNSSNSAALKSIHSSLSKTIDNQRQSVSGVDEDEEAMDLLKYQNAYALNAKAMQVLSEVYDRLILQTGV